MNDYPKGAEALLIAIQTPAPKGYMGIPVLVWGKPGVGKSSFLEGMADDNFSVLTLIASIHDPTDFSGLPIHHEGKVRFAIPEWVDQFGEEKDGLLFLDELTTAPPAVQAALLRVVLERKVGFHPLPKTVRIVAAANPPDMMTGGWELTPPLRNRFVHIQWSLSTQTYISGLENGFPKAERYHIPVDQHAELLPAWKLKIGAFLKRQPNLLETSPENDMYAFASPRSWEFAAALLASCEILGQAPTQGQSPSRACMTLLKGCIGEGASLPFLDFLKNLKLPNPDEVLDGKVKVDIKEFNDSELYVFFGSVTNAIMQRSEQPDFLSDIYTYFNLIKKVNENGRRDLVYAHIRRAVKGQLIGQGQRAARQSGEKDKAEMKKAIHELFADEALIKYINIFEDE